MTAPLLYYRGRVALYDILRQLGVGAGDEVALQAFTCVAVPEAVMAIGATPLWIDVAPNSVNMDPASLAARVTAKTKAVIAQHTFGIPADLDPIAAFATSRGLPVMEDCCHSMASTHKGRLLGSVGVAAFWSYEWGKPVIAGVGGEARFNDTALRSGAASEYSANFQPPPFRKSAVIAAQYVAFSLLYSPRRFWAIRRAFRAAGSARVIESNYNPVGPGAAMAADFGWRMCGFSRGRLARARARAADHLALRRRQAERYADGLCIDGVAIPPVPAEADAVYARFPIVVERKPALLAAARAANVEIADWFATPVHPLSGDDLSLVHYVDGSCPHAETMAQSLVSVPLGGKVTEDFQRDVIEVIRRHVRA